MGWGFGLAAATASASSSASGSRSAEAEGEGPRTLCCGAETLSSNGTSPRAEAVPRRATNAGGQQASRMGVIGRPLAFRRAPSRRPSLSRRPDSAYPMWTWAERPTRQARGSRSRTRRQAHAILEPAVDARSPADDLVRRRTVSHRLFAEFRHTEPAPLLRSTTSHDAAATPLDELGKRRLNRASCGRPLNERSHRERAEEQERRPGCAGAGVVGRKLSNQARRGGGVLRAPSSSGSSPPFDAVNRRRRENLRQRRHHRPREP